MERLESCARAAVKAAGNVVRCRGAVLLTAVVGMTGLGLGNVVLAAPADPYGGPCARNPSGRVAAINDITGATSCFPTIQAAVTGAAPDWTVLVPPGIYQENVVVPAGKDRLTIRSIRGPRYTAIVGAQTAPTTTATSTVSIQSSGVTFGGPRWGFTIRNTAVTPLPTLVNGISVIGHTTTPVAHVRVVGNVIGQLEAPNSTYRVPTNGAQVVGILVAGTRTDDVTVAGNAVSPLVFTGPSSGVTNIYGYGIAYTDGPNTNVRVFGNTVRGLRETGVPCTTTGLTGVTGGALGISVNDYSYGIAIARNAVGSISSPCLAVGIGTNAVPDGGPVNITGNAVDHITSAASPQSLGFAVGIQNFPTANTTAPFNVSRNQLSFAPVAVGVTTPSQLGADSTIQYNNFFRDPIGVLNNSTADVLAANNYWGCRRGPGPLPCASVSGGRIDFRPYLLHPVPPNRR